MISEPLFPDRGARVTLMPGTILDDLQEGLAQLPADVTPAGA